MVIEKIKVKKIEVINILFFLIILLEDAGLFGVLPLGVAQLLIMLMGAILVMQELYLKSDIEMPKGLLFVLLYMLLITLIFPFDADSITNFGLFAIEVVVFFLYVKRVDKSTILRIIYNAAFVLACIGIVQEIGYVLGISELCDMTIYGFPRECVYEVLGRPIARVSSLYSEPASLMAVMSAAFLINLFGERKEGVRVYKSAVIILFALLTQSTLIYLSYAIIMMAYLLFFKQEKIKKQKWFVIIVCGVVVLLLLGSEMVVAIFMKLTTLYHTSSTSTTDLSAFAVLSNLRIAIKKIKDGYILGTGFNSHRLYYEKYISVLYKEVLMKLSYSDAGSMFTRSLSEFGIVGFGYLVGGLIWRFINEWRRRSNYGMFCVIVLAMALLRDGNYVRTLSVLLLVSVFFTKNTDNCDGMSE